MVDVEFSTNYGEFFKKFSEAIAEAVKAMKKMCGILYEHGFKSNNWRKLHGMPMRRWRHLKNAAYNRQKHV